MDVYGLALHYVFCKCINFIGRSEDLQSKQLWKGKDLFPKTNQIRNIVLLVVNLQIQNNETCRAIKV